MNKEKMRVEEVAEEWGVAKVTIYAWIHDGLYAEKEWIPGRKPHYVIRYQDVLDYIEVKKGQTRK